jgi:sphingomyelin synthase-related protein 1
MSFGRELSNLLILCVITFIIGVLSTWYVWDRQPPHKPLPDVLLDILPDLSHIQFPIVNVVSILQYILAIISMPVKTRWQRVGQFLLMQFTINTFRAFTVSVTSLPNIHVYPYCEKRPDNFFQVLSYMIRYGTCSDYMFSGHTATSTLTWLLTRKFATREWYKWTVGILVDVMVVFLLLQRWHYTVDIIIAIVLTWFLFTTYYRFETDKYWWYFYSFILKESPRESREIELEQPNEYGRLKRFF